MTAPSPKPTDPSAFRLHTNPAVRHAVDLKDVLKGMPGDDPRDAIPPIYAPVYMAAGDAVLADDAGVLGLRVGDEARAYPIAILDHHEIVNDTVGGIPVAVTYCPLCGSGVVYDRRIAGRTLTLGVSGYLYQTDLLMWDHETESFWSQMENAAIVGPMTGTELTLIPASLTTWKAWRAEQPDTLLLAPPDPPFTDYALYPYDDYRTAERLKYPILHDDTRYPRKMIVTGIQIGDASIAYPHEELKKAPPRFHDKVGGQPLEIHYNAASNSCRIFDETGHELPSLTAFWFAWHTFHPQTAVYQRKV